MWVRMQRKRISFASLVGMQTGAATLENRMEVPQKIKNRTTLQPSNCTTKYLSKGYKYAVSKGPMHPIVYSITINNFPKYGKSPNVHQWMNEEEVVYMYTMEYYCAIKKNEILPFATTWMELEGIMLSEISQRNTKII